MRLIRKYLILSLLIFSLISAVLFSFGAIHNTPRKPINEINYPVSSDIIVDNYTIPGISEPISPDQIIKIGVLDDLNRLSGEHTKNGALLAAKEINLAGGVEINGTQYYVGIVAENTDEANPILDVVKGVVAAEKMVNVHDPHFIIGGFRTLALKAYVEVVMDAKKLFLGTGAAADYFCENIQYSYTRYKYWFRIMPLNFTSQTVELITYLAGLKGYLSALYGGIVDKIAIIREALDWTIPIYNLLQLYLPMLGYTITTDIAYPITATATDFATYWNQIDASGAQITIPLISAQGGIYMMQQYAALQPKCLIAGIDVQSQLDTFWDDTQGACQYEVIMQNIYRTNKTFLTIPFWDAYLAEYNKEPYYTGVGAYDAVYLMAEAINETQSFNTDNIINYLESFNRGNPSIGKSVTARYTAWNSAHDIVEGWPYGINLFAQWQLDGIKHVVTSVGLIYPDSIVTGQLSIPYWGIHNLFEGEDLPGDFILTTNAENPDRDGDFILSWTESMGANSYSIFSSDSPITYINQDLNLVAQQSDNSSYELINLKTGEYYFIVVSYNATGEKLSNCIYVNVQHPLPGEFTLSSDADSPDPDGTFNLSWTASAGADNYSIYKHTSPITDINETLELMAYQNATSPFSISESQEGNYYYVVVAANGTGETLSNNILVTIDFPPPGEFSLSSDADSPDSDGTFNLSWTASAGADNYSIYKHASHITDINETVELMAYQNATSPFLITELDEGDYYFMVVAYNEYGNTHSNNIFVIVTYPDSEIPGFDIGIIFFVISIISIVIIQKKRKIIFKQ